MVLLPVYTRNILGAGPGAYGLLVSAFGLGALLAAARLTQNVDRWGLRRNLLLSPEAHADAIPGLEILADDVRCTHAAAIAQVDKNQLFYLTSRGLTEADAKSLVIEGFLEALVERLAEGPVRDEISAALESRLAEIL